MPLRALPGGTAFPDDIKNNGSVALENEVRYWQQKGLTHHTLQCHNYWQLGASEKIAIVNAFGVHTPFTIKQIDFANRRPTTMPMNWAPVNDLWAAVQNNSRKSDLSLIRNSTNFYEKFYITIEDTMIDTGAITAPITHDKVAFLAPVKIKCGMLFLSEPKNPDSHQCLRTREFTVVETADSFITIMLALHVNAIVLVQPAVSPCTPWDHPVYAQVTSLHTEAMDVRHQRWLRQAVSFVADGGCRHGHVIKATPSRRVCDGEPSVFVDDASPVAPVVALISSKIALPVARYCADHVLELQHAILSRILGDTSTPAWRNIYAILHGLVPNAAHPVATDVLLWIDPRSGSIGAFRLQHAIDYAHFGDGDNATTGNEALGDSYQLDPADACRALAPYVISEEPVSSSHPLDGLFDVSVDDDVTCAAPDQAAVLPPSPARAKRAPGFARPL